MIRILFLTDLHGVRGYLPLLLNRESDVNIVLVGGDITSFGGRDPARTMLEPLIDACPMTRAVQGNVDLPDVLTWLENQGISLHGRGEKIGELGVFGCGGSNHTPMQTPTEYEEAEIESLLSQGYESVRQCARKVLICHCPPKDTTLDRMFAGKNVGSTALRTFLENEEVDLCLCGHIHEAGGIERVGSAIVVNPGAFCGGNYAVIQIEGEEIQAEIRRLNLRRRQRARVSATGLAVKVVGYIRYRLGS